MHIDILEREVRERGRERETACFVVVVFLGGGGGGVLLIAPAT